MMGNEDMDTCKSRWWKIAIGIAALLALLLWLIVGWSFWQALFAGIVLAIILGVVLGNVKCKAPEAVAPRPAPKPTPAPAPAEPVAPAEDAPAEAAPVAPEPVSAPDPAPKPATAQGATAAAVVNPSTRLPGQEDLAARKGSWKYENPQAKTQPVAAVDDEAKPELLVGPRGDSGDDLKLISGVGPKLEGMLNSLGVWHFDQVASWSDDQVAWVNDNLQGFKGRIARDNWVEQARILAAGGETEFSARKKK